MIRVSKRQTDKELLLVSFLVRGDVAATGVVDKSLGEEDCDFRRGIVALLVYTYRQRYKQTRTASWFPSRPYGGSRRQRRYWSRRQVVGEEDFDAVEGVA